MIVWAVQTIAITAVMAVLIAVVGRLAKPAPAVVHLLWLLVLIRFVVPPVIEWPWPLTSFVEQPQAPAPAGPAGPVPVLRLIGEPPQTAPVFEPAADRPDPAPYWRTLAESIPWQTWVLGLWTLSIVVVAAMQLFRILRIRRLLNDAVPAPDWMQQDVNALAVRIKTAPPDVEVTERIPVPVYCNLGRARLLVPHALLDTLDRDAWTSIFLHELAHHKRRDHWIGWLELIAGCVWWWNPVFWYARRRLREHAELACDARVIAEFPDKRRDYANALLSVFESVSHRAQRRLAWSMAADIRLGFERRLKMIYTDRIARRTHPAWFAAALLLAVLVTPVWSLQEPEAPPSSAEAAKPAAPLTPVPESTPAPDPIPDDTEVPAPEATPEAETPPALSEVQKALDNAFVSIEFTDQHIASVAGFIADYVEVNIVLDYRVIRPMAQVQTIPEPAYVSDGKVHFISLKNLSLRDALHALCLQQSLSFQAAPGFIWLSSPERIAAETWPMPSAEKDPELARALHDAYVTIEFENEHINRIIGFVSDYVEVNIVLDSRVIAPVPQAATEGDEQESAIPPAPAGRYVTTGMVPMINLRNVSLHEALIALLRPLNLAYRVEPGFIWISSPEMLEGQAPPQVRVPVHEEKNAATPPAKLLQIIQWRDGSYRARIQTPHETGWYAEGETFGGEAVGRFQLLKVNPNEGRVSLQNTQTGDILYLSIEPTPPQEEKTASGVSAKILQIIQWRDGSYRVQIQTPEETGWYGEGETIGGLRIVKVSPLEGGVRVEDTVTGAILFLLMDPQLPQEATRITPAASRAERLEHSQANDADDPIVRIEFDNQHLTAILGFLAKYARVNFALDYRAIQPLHGIATIPEPVYVTDGMVEHIDVRDRPLSEALRDLLQPLELDFAVTPGFIWISTPENIESETWPALDPNDTSAIGAIVRKPMSLEFEDEHINRILDFVGGYLDVAILVDPRAVPPPETIDLAEGMVTTGMVPYITIKNAPFHDALLALLRPLNLAYSIQENFIWVSSEALVNDAPPDAVERARAAVGAEAPTAGAPPTPPPPQDLSARVLRIVPWTDGTYRAEVSVGDRNRYYAEGEAFETFEVRAIDPETNTVSIWNERSARIETIEARP